MRRMGRIADWQRYGRICINCLLWCAAGAGIGILFALAVSSDMRLTLAKHLEQQMAYLLAENSTPAVYFLKRCVTYARLLAVVWVLEYFAFGYLGVRLLMLAKGFVFGFSQVAWVSLYGLKGLWLAAVAYWPHHLLWILASAWIEWMQRGRICGGPLPVRQAAALSICLTAVLALAEAYGAPALLRYFA